MSIENWTVDLINLFESQLLLKVRDGTPVNILMKYDNYRKVIGSKN